MDKKFDFVIFGMGYDWAFKEPPPMSEILAKGLNPDSLLHEYLPRPYRQFGHYKVASFLRKRGFSVKCVDFLFSYTDIELKAIIDKYVSDETLAIGFSLMAGNLGFDFFQNQFLKRVEKIKDLSQKKIIFGGKLRNDFTENQRYFDAPDVIIYNESEKAILKILTDLRNSGKFDLAFKLKKDMDAFVYQPNESEENSDLNIMFTEDDHIYPGEPIAIELSRGCMFNCSFCNYPMRGKSRFDFIADINEVREMLIRNYEERGITSYNLLDSTFNDSTERMKEFADLVKTLPFKPKFFAFLKPDLLLKSPEQIQLLKEIGVILGFFGVETLNPETLRVIKKSGAAEDLIRVFTELKRISPETSVHVNLVVGLPHETRETFLENLKFLMSHSDVIDSISATSLILNREENMDPTALSAFTQNPEKFGYRKFYDETRHKYVWENSTNGLTYDSAQELVQECSAMLEEFNRKDTEKGPVFWRVYEMFFREQPNVSAQSIISSYKRALFA